ncbi:hypothetical protein SAMN05421863_101473 [Nitrosomonas communis]|uniref:Uncharacterized protein n=1 Tax=Nitrosomonas communis TaxID=44574 RepID=A0A1I4NF66_9PROT|nr:hypothetical protein SAMN05421863_101473 [Nitrosomonas communis]
MMDVNQTPPEKMTPEQRRQEIASILANGIARLRTAGSQQHAVMATESKFELDSSGQRSVHSNPSTK